MQGMTNHHLSAVSMAAVCQGKAVHAELRTTCSQIITGQLREMGQMLVWLHTWYGETQVPQLSPSERQMVVVLASLPPADFEVAFMQEMIQHHMMAIEEAETCLASAGHPELLSLCQNIITTQGAEITQLQSWLCEWYGVCTEAMTTEPRL